MFSSLPSGRGYTTKFKQANHNVIKIRMTQENINGFDMFSTPINKTKVRNGLYAYKYRNGCVNIAGNKYFGYSVRDAIKLFRAKN